MSLTPSTMIPLGTQAPDFALPDVVTNKMIGLKNFTEKRALLVIFMCRHCPYVQHVKTELARIGKDYRDKDVAVVGISANDAENYPQDAPESLAEFAKEQSFLFPILYDTTQAVAKAYTAACTPDFFLFNQDRKLVYRGQIDDSRPGNKMELTGHDLRAALNAVLADKPVEQNQKPATGCNIKWKPGNAPNYAQ